MIDYWKLKFDPKAEKQDQRGSQKACCERCISLMNTLAPAHQPARPIRAPSVEERYMSK